MATASPRLRVNQCEMSAASGANMAEIPKRPESTPSDTQNCQNSVAKAAPAMPAGSPTHPIRTGTITPARSLRRPIATPPTPPVIMNIM